MGVTNLGALSLVLNAAGQNGVFGLIQDPQLTTEQSQMAVHNPDTQEAIPKGKASLVNWIKATIRSVYTEKGDCPISAINVGLLL